MQYMVFQIIKKHNAFLIAADWMSLLEYDICGKYGITSSDMQISSDGEVLAITYSA